MPFHLCGGCCFCDIVPDCIDKGCCKPCCAAVPCCGERPKDYKPWNEKRCCADHTQECRYNYCVCASHQFCSCCCADACVIDPCAICCGEYKGNLDHLVEQIDKQYEIKRGGAPAEQEMAR